MFDFRTYCRAHPRLRELFPQLQLSSDLDDEARSGINPFSATNYRVVHFVVDMPVRLPDSWLAATPPATRALGPVIFVQTEFQLIDRETEHANELGEASHSSYKERQKLAVMRRLKLGSSGNKAPAVVTQPPLRVVAPTKRPPPPRRKKT